MADSNGFGGGHAVYTIARTYKIMGTFQGNTEEVDCDIDSEAYAETLVTEYKMAFGEGWTFEIKEED